MNRVCNFSAALIRLFIVYTFYLIASPDLSCGATSPLQPVRLRCEYLENPQGISVSTPRLGWSFEVRDQKLRGLSQTAYQILVASDRKQLARNVGDIWDTGKTNSSACSQIVYAGDFLMPGQHCFWKVRVWDQVDQPSAWSEPAYWTMGLFSRIDWQGKWIGWEDPEPVEKAPPTLAGSRWVWFSEGEPEKTAPVGKRYFRRVIEVPSSGGIKKAELLFTGDSTCEFWINGARVGRSSDFHFATHVDVRENLKPGSNRLAVLVDNPGTRPNPAGLVAELVIELESGATLKVITDGTWESSNEKVDGWNSSANSGGDWQPCRELGEVGMMPWGEITRPEDRELVARMFRREFEVDTRFERVTVYASGLGLSELYLNGSKLGTQVLSPGLTDYDKRVFYVSHDVTDLVKRGKNVLGAIVGNGRYYGPRAPSAGTVNYGHPKLLLQMVVEHRDGSTTYIVSDEGWNVTTNGPVRINNEYDGEVYDARLEMPGWASPGFDDSAWNRVHLVKPPDGKMVAEMIDPIRVIERIKPVLVSQPKPGVFVFDMGQNIVGWCRLRVSGPAGTEVRMRHAETLQPDGTLYLENLRSAKATDVYILKGRGVENYEPRFTYHGFRYVEVTGFPGRPSLSSIEGCVVHDDLEEAGSFECSNPLLNQIYQNIRWGVRGNYRSIPTDCPQRDERQAWLGDRSAECKGESYMFNIAALYGKWVQDFADAQRESGSVPDVAPAYWPFYSDNVTWPSSTVIIPDVLREQYGDTAIIQRHYASASKWLEYMSQFVTNGIIMRDRYGDWCVPPEELTLIHTRDPARKTDTNLLSTAYFYYDLKLLANYANALGRKAEGRRHTLFAEQVKTAFNELFFNPDEGYYANGSQTSCVLPLAFDLVPDEHRKRVFEHLVKKITEESEKHIGTGLIGGQWLMRVLTENGRADLAYTIATQRTYPSWGYMIEKGATTIWELWNGDTADPAMNSGNHVMLVGDLAVWMFEDLAGIKPDPQQPGFKHILMRPQPVGDLRFVKAAHQSPYGRIVSEWQQNGAVFSWKVSMPPNTTATISIPAASAQAVFESGRPIANVGGVTFVKLDGGRAIYTVGSGNYAFESR